MSNIERQALSGNHGTLASRGWHGAVFLVGIVLFLHAIEDPDIWYHMTIGRAVLDTGAVPAEEFYVFTRLGEAAEFHEWGFGVLFHLAHEIAGPGGMIVLNALIGATTLFLLYLMVLARGYSAAVAIAAVAAGFWLMEFRFVMRPETLLYLALAATLYFLQRYQAEGDWRWLIAVPLVGLALAQCHPSVLMLVLVLGAFLVEQVAKRQPDWRRAGQIAAAMLVTTLVSMLNPYGVEQFILPVSFMLEEGLLASISEFLPALSTEYAPRFLVGVGLALFALVGVRKRFALAEWLILLAFIFLAYQHVRNIALIGVVLVLPLATALDRLLQQRASQMVAAGLLVLCVAIDAGRLHRLSFDVEPWTAPMQSAETIAQLAPSGNLLNFYHLGNYLAWRLKDSHRVLIDGRNFRDNPSLSLHDRILSASRGWDLLLDKYAIVAAVLPATLPYSGNFVPLAQELVKHPDWVLLGREGAGLLFVRRSIYERNAPHALIDSAPLPPIQLWLQARDELRFNLSIYPESQSSRRSLQVVEQRLLESGR